MSADKIKIAVVGGAHASAVTLPALMSTEEFSVSTFCARSLDVQHYKSVRDAELPVLSNWRDLISELSLDAVALALPPKIQEEIALPLIESGKALFCEKPISATLGGAQAMLDAAKENNVSLAFNFGFRYSTAFRALYDLVSTGAMGNVVAVSVDWMLATRSNKNLSMNWKSDLSMGGGSVYTMGSHVLDYISWIFGSLSDINVQRGTMVRERPEFEGSQNLASVTADDSCLISGNCGMGAPFSARIYTAVPVSLGHSVTVFFEQGYARLANGPNDDTYSNFILSFHGEKGAIECRSFYDDRITVTRRVVSQFAKIILAGERAPISNEELLRVQECLIPIDTLPEFKRAD